MTIKMRTIAAILGTIWVGGCSGLWGNDEFERYSQRTDAITMSAGNAKETNAITHMYHPWPPGVQDRQIASDGPRMQRALERYRRAVRPPDPLPNIGLEGTALGPGGQVPGEPAPQRGQPAPGAAFGQ